MIAGSLLPPGSEPIEHALDAAIGSRFPLRTDLVLAMWSPDRCPAELLGFLAYQLSVDLWDEAWPETQKRQVCRDAFKLHRLKTTVAGIRAYVALTGAELVKVIRPPSKIYATSGMTPAEREAWLQTLPQIRLYPFDRRPLGSRQAFLSGPSGRFFFPGCYPRPSRGFQLTGTRATRWDQGVETPIDYEQLDAGAIRMLIPSTGRRTFLGHSFFGRAFAQISAATNNVVTLRLSGDIAGFAAASGLDPVDIEPTRIFQPRTAPQARAFFGNATGRRWLMSSWSPRLVYDRVSLNDPTRIAARRVGRVYLGHAGRVYDRNDDDYFDFGRAGSLKLRSSERLIKVDYDPEAMPTAWIEPLCVAWGAKGLVVTAFWLASLFAEQLRADQASLAFLEITGLPGTGKSTLLEFLWRLVGRDNYEGFDPTGAKATAAAIARNLGKVANLPVVLIEGDRSQDVSHVRRFEWDELKTAYNGRPVRSRGVANGGMETFEPPFRGAIVIAQNDPVEASPAMRERIMALHFDKSGWTPQTKHAAEQIERTPVEQVSGFLIHVLRREEALLAHYRERFRHHEKEMLADPEVRNGRLAKNHAQLAAMLDCLKWLPLGIPLANITEAQALIRTMLIERHRVVNSEHPFVEAFWERFDWLFGKRAESGGGDINHHRTARHIAISMPEFEQLCGTYKLQPIAPMRELQRQLRTSKARRFIGTKTVNSINGGSQHCWVFEDPQQLSPATR